MQSENATTIQVQKKCKKKVNKNAKKCKQKCNFKKNANKNAKKMQIAFVRFFCIFWKGFRQGLNFFSKIAKNLGKMQKKCKQNAKKMQTKFRKKCKFWKCACFTKTNFQKLHCFCIFACIFACIFFAFSWAKVFRVAFSGCILFTWFLHFNQVWKSLERARFYHTRTRILIGQSSSKELSSLLNDFMKQKQPLALFECGADLPSMTVHAS